MAIEILHFFKKCEGLLLGTVHDILNVFRTKFELQHLYKIPTRIKVINQVVYLIVDPGDFK
jgi:hypothetical protein